MGELRSWRYNSELTGYEGDFVVWQQTSLTPTTKIMPVKIPSIEIKEVRDKYDYLLIEKKNGSIYIAYKNTQLPEV